MHQPFVIISASGPEEAGDLAATQLGVSVEELAVTSLGKGKYRAELLDHDAYLQVEISEDKMAATVAEFVPARGTGGNLTPEGVLSGLKQAGVRIEPPAERIAALVEKMNRGEDVFNAVIVRGRKPRAARPAAIEPDGDYEFPVFPGEVIGEYVAPQPAKEGISVTGERKPAEGESKPRDIAFPPDGGCRLESDSSRVIAEHYGLVSLEEQKISVKPLIQVTEDNMAVKATVYAHTFSGDPTTAELFGDVLARMQIKAKLREQTLMQAVKKAEEQNAPVEDVYLCRRLLPKNGQDGRFELAVKSALDVDSPGQEDSSGSVDYRARDMIRSVQADDFLGRLIPPQAGVPSQDVYGRAVPAKDGQPARVQAGENVRVSEDGSEFYATAEGMVVFLDNTLKVTEVFEVNGDVDLAVGNINLERGSVYISGSVLGGLKVEAPGNVIVGDVVEDAVIVAGGDVQVGRGIIINHEGRVQAGGGISAMYAQNATLSAGTDVEIAHELKNCSVFAGKNVNASKGRGKIVGGDLHCGEGVLAREIGSPLGVETLIYVGVDSQIEEGMTRKKELEESLQKIYNSLGSGDVRTILEKAPPSKRQIVAKVLRARVESEKELKQIKERIKQDREARLGCDRVRVKALQTIHPDVVVSCSNSQFRVDSPLSAPTIVFDSAQRKLVLA
jgi:hypothetical protein